MNATDTIDVFVSYATGDRDRIRPLVEALEAAGLSAWWDRRIAPGSRFDDEIQQALDCARCVLVVWSPRSIDSEWVVAEASEGLERGVLVPVTIEGARPPLAFRRRQTLAFDDTNAIERLVVAVQAVLAGESADLPQSRPQLPRLGAPFGLAAAVAVGMLAGVALLMSAQSYRQADPPPRPSAMRLPLDLPNWDFAQSGGMPTGVLALSASGDRLAFVARGPEGRAHLRVRHMDTLATTSLPGTNDAEQPFFSPDGESVGFFQGSSIRWVSLAGGEPATVLQELDREIVGASWGEGDEIVYAAGRSGLGSVLVGGGKPEILTRLDPERLEGSHRLPHHVRGHDQLLFTVYIAGDRPRHEVWLLDRATGERQYLFDGLAAVYVGSGHILHSRPGGLGSGSLWATPFDPGEAAVTGPARPVQSAIAGREGTHFAVSFAGAVVYNPVQGGVFGQLIVRDPTGSERVIDSGPYFEAPRFSHDRRSLAVEALGDRDNSPSVRVHDLTTGSVQEIRDARSPLFTSDDLGVVVERTGVGLVRLGFAKGANEVLVSHDRRVMPEAWLEDGQTLLYKIVRPGTGHHLYSLSRDGTRREVYSGNGVSTPSLTNDQRWIAWWTYPRGVQIAPFENMGASTLVTSTGTVPRWSGSGRGLYFEDGGNIWFAETVLERGAALGEPQKITNLGRPTSQYFDVDESGRMAFTRHRYSEPKPPVLLINWL